MPKLCTRPEQLIPTLQDWKQWELEDLQAMIQGLLEAQQLLDSSFAPSDLPTHADGSALGQRGGRGCIELKLISDTKCGKVYGPYRYLRDRAISRRAGEMALLSVYLGKGSDKGVR